LRREEKIERRKDGIGETGKLPDDGGQGPDEEQKLRSGEIEKRRTAVGRGQGLVTRRKSRR